MALHDEPFHLAMRFALEIPPAEVKLPPTYSTPGLSVLRAVTAPLSDGTVDVAPTPTRFQPPGQRADARGGSATATAGAAPEVAGMEERRRGSAQLSKIAEVSR